jgi:hypothetical protein
VNGNLETMSKQRITTFLRITRPDIVLEGLRKTCCVYRLLGPNVLPFLSKQSGVLLNLSLLPSKSMHEAID